MSLYHEKQSLKRCGLHSVNNLLQGPRFDVKMMDAIAKELAPDTFFNPHMNVLGDYDITVISSALQQHGLKLVWFNASKYTASNILYSSLHGIIVNKHTPGFLWGSTPHWLSVLRVQSPVQTPITLDNGAWVNLDSKLKDPKEISDIEGFIRDTLAEAKKNKPVVLLLVIPDTMRDEDVYLPTTAEQ